MGPAPTLFRVTRRKETQFATVHWVVGPALGNLDGCDRSGRQRMLRDCGRTRQPANMQIEMRRRR